MTTVRFSCYSALFALVASTILACSDLPGPDAFKAGVSREQLLETYGTPSREQTFIKKDEAIWGPIEDFWVRVPLNSSVEVWTYRVKGGSIELYFIDKSAEVQGTGFAPDGVDF